jgi:hypothetical protein
VLLLSPTLLLIIEYSNEQSPCVMAWMSRKRRKFVARNCICVSLILFITAPLCPTSHMVHTAICCMLTHQRRSDEVIWKLIYMAPEMRVTYYCQYNELRKLLRALHAVSKTWNRYWWESLGEGPLETARGSSFVVRTGWWMVHTGGVLC